eukprot:10220998-Alexandrium_andersonii.AAC.1
MMSSVCTAVGRTSWARRQWKRWRLIAAFGSVHDMRMLRGDPLRQACNGSDVARLFGLRQCGFFRSEPKTVAQ